MPLGPNVSFPSSTEMSVLPAASRRAGAGLHVAVRLAAAGWAILVYAVYWLGYLPHGR